MKLILKFLLLLVLLAIILLGYFGFVPGLSTLFGANKPRDLSVESTAADYDAYVQKAGVELSYFTNAPHPTKSFNASGKKDSKQSFSQEEISGRLSFAKWKHMPVDKVQVRIGEDGTGEVSGMIRVDRLAGFLAVFGATDVPTADIQKWLGLLGIGGNPPFYAKVKASVNDNKAEVTLLSAQLGRLPIPVEELNKSDVLAAATNEILSRIEGLYAKRVVFVNGKMEFEGTVPETMLVETAQE